MGSTLNTQRDSYTCEEEELDFSALRQYINMPNSNNDGNQQDFKIDAAVTTLETLVIHPITYEHLCNINELLDTYEKFSLVFLLTRDPNLIFDEMEKVRQNNNEFQQFLSDLIKHGNGRNELIEALCVIQNYEVLKMLGYRKEQLETEFLPLTYHTCVYINKTKKLLYRIIEKFTEEEEKNIIELIKEDHKGTDFSNFNYFEMYVAYLLKINYLQENDLSNIRKHFKALDLDHYVQLLSMEMPRIIIQKTDLRLQSSNILNTDKSTAKMGMPSDIGGPSVVRTKVIKVNEAADVYHIDTNNPGIAVIIENIEFYEEPDEKYKDLVIVTNTALQRRVGSDHDSRRLSGLFKRFGYTVIHKENLTHVQMLDELQDIAHNQITEVHSSLILVMLSHGLENQIIGCNSVPLNVDEIKKKINSKALEGKPKILIFQACQGNEIMRDVRNLNVQTDDLVTDGPRQSQHSHSPWQRHILEMWSTVPGYASFRSMSRGSWLIQTLCDVLESSYRSESFAEICTHVHRKIGEKWVEFEENHRNVMVPNYISTLDKKFFLPSLKDIASSDTFK